jgi:hypothetical protein
MLDVLSKYLSSSCQVLNAGERYLALPIIDLDQLTPLSEHHISIGGGKHYTGVPWIFGMNR